MSDSTAQAHDDDLADTQLALPRRPRSLRRVALSIVGTYILLAAVIVSGAAVLITRDRDQETHRAEAELSSLARALEEHVARSFGQMDTVLDALGKQVGENGGPERFGERALYELTSEWLLRVPQAAIVSAYSRDGALLSATYQYPLTKHSPLPAAVTQRLAATANAAMQIGAPIRAPDSGRWLIPLTRRINRGDGSLAGFLTAALSTSYFEFFYQDIRLTRDDAISVLTSDGTLLVRYPANDAQIGVDFSRNPAMVRPATHATRVVERISWIDSQPRIIAARGLDNYPLIVQVSRPRQTALRSFYANTERIVWGCTLLCGLLAVLAWVVFEDVRRRERARRTLHRLAQSLEARVKERTAELESSNRELLAFSYSVSHDLRAPLRAINGFSHALLEDYAPQLDATGRDYLQRVARASVRMGELIDELLKLANVARQPLDIRTVDLSALAADIAADLKSGSPARAARFEIQPGMLADADEPLLRNVLGNLLDNAWKFTRDREEALIRVSCTEEEGGQRFAVSDNGVGFDMVYAGRLFQPFQQLHGGQGYAGTGIGLASARRIIERHGGKMHAESMPGEGTTVYFTLPRRAAVVRKRRNPQS